MESVSSFSSSSTKEVKESKSAKNKKRPSKSSAKEGKGEFSKACKDSDLAQSYKTEKPSIDVEALMHGDGEADNESEQLSIAESFLEVSSEYDSKIGRSPYNEDQSCEASQGPVESTVTIKDVNEYLKRKVGFDAVAKHWLEECSGLDDVEKSEVILRLAYEVCLAKNIEYDIENDAAGNEKENNKDMNFDTRRIFEIIKKVNRLILSQDRRRLVEFVSQNGNVTLLEMICRQGPEDPGHRAGVLERDQRKEDFTGYKTLIELLQYILEKRCSPKIVLCIAKKIYGTHHNVCNGRKYLKYSQIQSMEETLNQPISVMEECLRKAVELDYKEALSVMLSSDIYYCIRLMKDQRFQEEETFSEALDMVKETVAEVMSSWANDEDLLKELQGLLMEGIAVDLNKMGKKELIDELEYRGIELSKNYKKSKEKLVEKLEKEGGKMRQGLEKTVVGALILTLFFNYQNKLDVKPFELKISFREESERKKEIKEFNHNIDSRNFIKSKVLKSIQSLNCSSHIFNNWFFREVLVKIVNDKGRFNKLKAVCAAICKEPMQELIKDVEVHEDVVQVLEFFGVEPNRIKASTPKQAHPGVTIFSHFAGDIENLVRGIRELKDPSLMEHEISNIARGLARSKVPAFSGLTRRTIRNLKNKRDL